MTPPLSDAELAEMRAMLAELHIRGRWQLGTAGSANIVDYDGDDIVGVAYVEYEPRRRWIAAAPESMARLLDEVTRYRGLEPLVKELASYAGSNTHAFPFNPDDMSCAPLRLWMPLWEALKGASDAG